jgi:hypothetical protein
MIIKDSEAAARLNSPINLINKLRSISSKKNDAMSLFGIGSRREENPKPEVRSFNPFQASPEQPSENQRQTSESPTQLPARIASEESNEPNLDTILKNNESQIKLGLAHDKALDLLHSSLQQLSAKLDDVKADKLPSVISAASKTVESIRRERNESLKNSRDQEVHYHFYTPQQRKLETYEVIDVA